MKPKDELLIEILEDLVKEVNKQIDEYGYTLHFIKNKIDKLKLLLNNNNDS